MNTVLITGATAGIGRATAIKFAQNNYNLIITGRREELLKKLTFELKNEYKVDVLPLCFDIRNNTEVEKAINSLPNEWRTIDILINNAGLAVGLNPFYSGIVEDWERMIDTNVKGLLYISKLVANIMIENKKGHIINISSIAGKEVYPNGNVYCATKHAVEAISKGMRMELINYGIKVTVINPGAAETEFSIVRFKGDIQKAKNVYSGYKPLVAEDIANVIWFAASLPPHVNITELTVMPAAQATTTIFNKNI